MSDDIGFIHENVGKLVSGFFVVAGSVLVFLSRLLVMREVQRIDDRHNELADAMTKHAARVEALSQVFATKADMDRLYSYLGRMDAHIADMGRHSEERHEKLFELIARKFGS
jgi:hypothetical protein